MSFLAEIDKIRGNSFSFAFWGSVLLTAPGLSYILLFFPDYLFSLETVKLILVSISIITPFLATNIFSVFFLFELMREKDFSGDLFATSFFSLAISVMVLYLSLFLSFVFKLSFHQSIYLNLAFQAMVTTSGLLALKRAILKSNGVS